MTGEITSIKDNAVVQARILHTAAGRREINKCLLEGEEIISWALSAGWELEMIFIDAKLGSQAFSRTLAASGVPCFTVSGGILKKISQTNYLIPYIGVSRIPPHNGNLGDFVVVLDDVRDHGNIGTIVRTACAFGIHEIISTLPDVDFFYRKVIEASRGTIFNVTSMRYPSALETVSDLKTKGYAVVATSPHAKGSQSLVKIKDGKIALVVGNETYGVSRDIIDNADFVVRIPMTNTVESLNVGVAAGISLYEIKLKQVIFMLKKNIQMSLGREVNVTGKLIQKAFDERLSSETPYKSDQIIFLMILKCDIEMSRRQICKDLALSEREFEEMIAPLIEEELVQVRDGQRYFLTEQGERYLAQIWGLLDRIEDEIFADFSREERQRFLENLQHLQKRCIMINGERSATK